MKRIWEISVEALPVILLLAFGSGCSGTADSNKMSVRRDRARLSITVDPRVELMGVIFHLASNPEYNRCRSKQYTRQ